MSTTFVTLAALCWGLSGGIGAILMSRGWGIFVVSFYRGAIGLAFVLVWLVLQRRDTGFANHQLWFWSMIAGLGVAGNFVFYFMSIAKGSVAVAATLMYCAPVFTYLVSFTLKLEKPTLLKCAAIVIVTLGIVLLTRIYESGVESVTLIGAGAGLLSGLCYALFIFGFKYAAPHGSPQAILVIAFSVLVSLLIWPGDVDQIFAALNTSSLPLFVLMGVLGAGLSFVLYIIGLNHTAPAVASVVAMVEPVTATLFGVLILHESLVTLQIFGMCLILLTVTALSVFSNAR